MIDEPVGNHQGGSVAAPVFNLIAEAALGDYVIPPDDKAFRDSLAALSKEYESQPKDSENRGSSIEDRASKIEPVNNLRSSVLDARSSTLDPAQVFVMPDFRGRGVRAVTQACAQMNLVISLRGSGMAFRQSPAAGSKVRAGETCKVEFQ
jgi:hypothetical protein